MLFHGLDRQLDNRHILELRTADMVVVIMGPSGAGKTTVGRLVAEALNWPFYDGDDFHPEGNVARMRSGVPLTDAERSPWLATLARLVAEAVAEHRPAVLACSALTREHRRRLAPGVPANGVRFVYLEAAPTLLAERLAARPNHFFPLALLASQLAVLEPPREGEPVPVITVDAAASPPVLVAEIRRALGV